MTVFYRQRPGWRFPTAVRADGVWIWDADGRRLLDAAGGALVVNVGHGVAEIADAIAEQARTLPYVHGSELTSEPVERLAKELARRAPVDDARLYLVSGGSEATETAIKLARQYHLARGDGGRYKVVARWPSYHGCSVGALAVSGRPTLRAGFEPLLPAMPFAPAPYPYRCELPGCGKTCTLECAEALDAVIRREGAGSVAAFIAEPVVGASAGAVVPPPDYYRIVRETCDRHGVLFIADEVMTGMGRTGRWFAMEHWGVKPDILTTGKGVTSGYVPGGAVLASGGVVDTVQAAGGFHHGFTYSHHPVVAATGLAVIRYLERHELVARADVTGRHLLRRLGGSPTFRPSATCVGSGSWPRWRSSRTAEPGRRIRRRREWPSVSRRRPSHAASSSMPLGVRRPAEATSFFWVRRSRSRRERSTSRWTSSPTQLRRRREGEDRCEDAFPASSLGCPFPALTYRFFQS